ncbi:MAG: SDR family oxidoreductase [Desulfobacterales bacterium]|jgi:short-subunit dehydrogenase
MTDAYFMDNVTIITGASSGIGRELAFQLTELGAWLSLADCNTEQLKETSTICRQRGGQTLVIDTDVGQKSRCKNLIEQTVAAYGRIDSLINNAGITMVSRFDQTRAPELIERVMQVNFFGSVYCTYYALPYLKKSQGRIVAISSLAGKTGLPGRSGYAASKHAMAGFFDTLRLELADDGVSVTTIFPGFVATNLRQLAIGPDGRLLEKSPVRELKAMTAEMCARQIIRAVALRKRELIMTGRGKIGLWLKLIAPGLVDRMARSAAAQGQ